MEFSQKKEENLIASGWTTFFVTERKMDFEHVFFTILSFVHFG